MWANGKQMTITRKCATKNCRNAAQPSSDYCLTCDQKREQAEAEEWRLKFSRRWDAVESVTGTPVDQSKLWKNKPLTAQEMIDEGRY